MTSALLLSASRADNTGYLEHTLPLISSFLNIDQSAATAEVNNEEQNVLFIPYAGVSISFDDYTHQVEQALASLPLNIKGIHEFDSNDAAFDYADVILVGGGNTFVLLDRLYQNGVYELIQKAVASGTKYIGWSAGSNIAGLSIKTTNDMPIVEPQSFKALSLLPIQLNPHYTDFKPPGHHGETRQMRIEEFMVMQPQTPVIGIQEGTALEYQDNVLKLVGNKPAYIFKNGEKQTVETAQQLNSLLGL